MHTRCNIRIFVTPVMHNGCNNELFVTPVMHNGCNIELFVTPVMHNGCVTGCHGRNIEGANCLIVSLSMKNTLPNLVEVMFIFWLTTYENFMCRYLSWVQLQALKPLCYGCNNICQDLFLAFLDIIN